MRLVPANPADIIHKAESLSKEGIAEQAVVLRWDSKAHGQIGRSRF